jgi:uncharacterized membrane protein YraQ (UPF0718 family)
MKKENIIKSILKEYALEIIISLIAIILIIFNPNKAYFGIKQAIENFKNLILVIIAVALLTGFISEVVSKETIKKFIGKKSGFKGVLIGAIFGSLMVGPAYVFFPFFKEMINKGAKINVIVTSITSWAIKVPWIPFAVILLGLKFVIFYNLLILLFAIISGYIVEYILVSLEKQKVKL